MSVLEKVDGYEDEVIKICPNGTLGDVVELGGILIGLPETPKRGIKGEGMEAGMQMWERLPMPAETVPYSKHG